MKKTYLRARLGDIIRKAQNLKEDVKYLDRDGLQLTAEDRRRVFGYGLDEIWQAVTDLRDELRKPRKANR